MRKYYFKTLVIALIPVLFVRSACVTTTNDPEQLTQSMRYYLGYGGNSQAKDQLLKVIQSAKTEIVAVFNDLADTDISSALIEKANAGLKVGVGGDKRNEGNAGFQALKAQRPGKFQTYFDATTAANAEPNLNLRNTILRTRLNFNRNKHPTKPRYDARANDGRVEYNFVVADKTHCWVSTGGANSETFSSGISVVFVFQSFDICNDFYNEAQQLAYGGLFGDEGAPSFGKFRYSKTITDPNFRFRIGDLIFNIFFAPQERPLTPVITELMRAEHSIKFASRALTQDVINDVATHSSNRSHMLNVFQYKSSIPQVYGQPFSVKGIVGTEIDSLASRTAVGSPFTVAQIPYNTLMSGTCPTVNSSSVTLNFYTSDYPDDPAASLPHPTVNTQNTTSIHCDLATLQTNIANSNVFSIGKFSSILNLNVFLTDYEWRKPRLIVMSSDLRKRYYFDDGGAQDAEPKRTRDDFFPITDAFVIIIEPAGSSTSTQIFKDFNSLLDTVIAQGGSL